MANGKELIDYKNALEEAFENQFPDITTIVFKRIEDDFRLPAIVINIPVLEPNFAANMPKGKTRATVQTAAFVLFSAADEANEMECLQLSANIGNFINGNNFGQAFPAKVTLIEPILVEGLENFIIQRIDFEQNIEIVSKN